MTTTKNNSEEILQDQQNQRPELSSLDLTSQETSKNKVSDFDRLVPIDLNAEEGVNSPILATFLLTGDKWQDLFSQCDEKQETLFKIHAISLDATALIDFNNLLSVKQALVNKLNLNTPGLPEIICQVENSINELFLSNCNYESDNVTRCAAQNIFYDATCLKISLIKIWVAEYGIRNEKYDFAIGRPYVTDVCEIYRSDRE